MSFILSDFKVFPFSSLQSKDFEWNENNKKEFNFLLEEKRDILVTNFNISTYCPYFYVKKNLRKFHPCNHILCPYCFGRAIRNLRLKISQHLRSFKNINCIFYFKTQELLWDPNYIDGERYYIESHLKIMNNKTKDLFSKVRHRGIDNGSRCWVVTTPSCVNKPIYQTYVPCINKYFVICCEPEGDAIYNSLYDEINKYTPNTVSSSLEISDSKNKSFIYSFSKLFNSSYLWNNEVLMNPIFQSFYDLILSLRRDRLFTFTNVLGVPKGFSSKHKKRNNKKNKGK